MLGGDYVIRRSHLHAGVALKDVPSGYLAFLVDAQADGDLDADLSDNLTEYFKEDPGAASKLDRGRRVPKEVVVKGFLPKPVTVDPL